MDVGSSQEDPPLDEVSKLAQRVLEFPGTGTDEEWEQLQAELARACLALPTDVLVATWEGWLEDAEAHLHTPRFHLHVAIPAVLVRASAPPEELVLAVLRMGIHYPEPSYNRYFVHAAIRHVGINGVLRECLRLSREGDQATIDRLPAALYWVYIDPFSIAETGPPRADHDRAEELRLRALLGLSGVANEWAGFLGAQDWRARARIIARSDVGLACLVLTISGFVLGAWGLRTIPDDPMAAVLGGGVLVILAAFLFLMAVVGPG